QKAAPRTIRNRSFPKHFAKKATGLQAAKKHKNLFGPILLQREMLKLISGTAAPSGSAMMNNRRLLQNQHRSSAKCRPSLKNRE
ncbi:MAG TPA: hypothetical protein PK062_07295, partial [Clostridia bacterium]|nr:hypothetical protein [Clostridia bacterium]